MGLTPGRACTARSRSVHPHVRGAHPSAPLELSHRRGPSPRAWGSRCRCDPRGPGGRSIPTCVGLTGRRLVRRSSGAVHPHVRGAHCLASANCAAVAGPSPRAWGSPTRHLIAPPGGRSIPTCVGLTRAGRSPSWPSTVHPHVRGAHWRRREKFSTPHGPSPRAWGSRHLTRTVFDSPRSIPTCVGLTRRANCSSASSAVHPHVRGAHPGRVGRTGSGSGPSPRAWGSHHGVLKPGSGRRSIPTCVGLTSHSD